jgi:23S rRNA pseudouridine2605 synthase
VRLLRHGARNSWLEIVLDEGKNRHIRRMLEALDVNVLRLIRVSIGPLELGELGKGKYRHLTAAERGAIRGAIEPPDKT